MLSELLCTVSSFILPLSTHKVSEHTASGSLAVILREDGCSEDYRNLREAVFGS